MSVALEICRLAEQQVGRDALARVITVGVEVGDESGLVPENLEFCLEALLGQPPFGGARPVIERRAGEVLRLTYLEVEDESETPRPPLAETAMAVEAVS
jgi:Zn finger protein HypA/HybF involved in hydrogenase expression